LSASFSYGQKDYYPGNSPVWQLCRVVYRITKQPVLIDGLALLAGYAWAALRRIKRPVTPELMQFHRREQMKKLNAIFHNLLRFKKIDSFSLVTQREGIALAEAEAESEVSLSRKAQRDAHLGRERL
jgi:hypothetical protein